MYSALLLSDFSSKILPDTIAGVKRDRDRYSTIWQIIEQYCAEHKLIISNKYTLLGMLDKLDPIYDRSYKIYTSNPFKHSNDLTNQIYQEISDSNPTDAPFIRLKTIKEQEEFVIEFDTRIVCVMYKLQKHKFVEPAAIIKPTEIDKLSYMPAEIELIDVYHDLYTMNNTHAEQQEELLFNQVAERKSSGIIGGWSGNNCKDRKKDLIEAIKVSLVKDWLYKKRTVKYVLVGPWAHDWMKHSDKLCTNVEKIQLVGDVQPMELLTELTGYINQIGKFHISVREQELHIPKDFRTSRYTYYLHIQSERGIVEKPFLDLFNSANFEVIPYSVMSGIPIGHKWVILRFLFIDLWIIRVIKTLGLISAEILTRKISYLWQLIDFFRKSGKLHSEPADKLDKPINESDVAFIGTYKDFVVDKRMDNLKEKIFYPYYPFIYYRNTGNYRKIK